MKEIFNKFLMEANVSGVRDILKEEKLLSSHYQVTEAGDILPHAEALDYLAGKSFNATGLLADDISGIVKRNIMAKIQNGWSVEEAVIALNSALLEFTGGIDSAGKRVDPYRTETIVRTNSTDAYNQGRLAQMRDPDLAEATFGYQYSAILDDRTTDVCARLHNRIFEPGDEDLKAYTPPLHMNCRSILTRVRIDDPERARGYITEEEKESADEVTPAGFGNNPTGTKGA